MEHYIKEATDETPRISLDAMSGVLELDGKSLPENVSTFYDPILEWLEMYESKPAAKTVFEMKLKYFNTASSKILLDILMKLEELKTEGNEVVVNWHYKDSDEDMQEAGEEYTEIVEDLPFEFKSY
jgi:hypothetical protein